MKLTLSLIASLLQATVAFAKTTKFQRTDGLSKTEFKEALEHCENNLPKVWSALTSIRESNVNIRLSPERKMGPGKAAGTDRMVLSTFFLINDLPKFPDDRLVVVIFHEFGLLLFNRETKQSERDRVKHEFFAFAYSIKATKALADNGDFGPLEQAIKNISLRAKNGKPKDPHTIAIKQLLETSLWSNAVAFMNTK